ncbi:MAG: PilT/PilU family type 4a pilus ATPase, partial [Verrucomicrobiota bacterium]
LTQIEQLCSLAVQHGAEDIFLKVGQIPHFRELGDVRPLSEQAVSQEELTQFWVACGASPETHREHDASWQTSSGLRFRVNLHRQLGLLSAALRPIKTAIPDLQSLGLPVELLQEWGRRKGGIVLVTGGTGSGKSTTIAALLNWINQQQSKHIVTIEDPIEYLIQPSKCIVTQREVGTDTDSFASGLKAALRQSPDVILVGEIRDVETARIAMQASETGHLVFATLHSADVPETFERMLALFSGTERASALMVLGTQLIGVLSQTLVPASEGGLHLLTEHLEISGATRRWLSSGDFEQIGEFMGRESSLGTQRFVDTAVASFRSGLISEETARSACRNPNEFDQRQSGVRSGSR